MVDARRKGDKLRIRKIYDTCPKQRMGKIYLGVEVFNAIGGDTAVKYSLTVPAPTLIINRRPHAKRVKQLVKRITDKATGAEKAWEQVDKLYVVDELPSPNISSTLLRLALYSEDDEKNSTKFQRNGDTIKEAQPTHEAEQIKTCSKEHFISN